MKNAFTLAEVLITLGIIGIVSALTLPSLIDKYQKHVYYTQFMKAANIMQNAINIYEHDNGCEGDLSLCCQNYREYDNHTCEEDDEFTNELIKHFNVMHHITKENATSICSNYDKNNIKDGYNTNTGSLGSEICANDMSASNATSAIITNDGILITLKQDLGMGGGNLIDVNGPNKGPNAMGRDIFMYYINKKLFWGGGYIVDTYQDYCTPDGGDGCAQKLLQDGKMNY